MSIDTDAAFRAILTSASAVTNLVGTRVYEGYLPEGTAANTQIARPAISYDVDPASPGDDDTEAGADIDYVVRCWADTTVAARGAYSAIKDAIKAVNNQSFASVFCYEGREIKPGRNNEDPETGQTYCEAVFRVGFRL